MRVALLSWPGPGGGFLWVAESGAIRHAGFTPDRREGLRRAIDAMAGYAAAGWVPGVAL